jgi:hypothetical protein
LKATRRLPLLQIILAPILCRSFILTECVKGGYDTVNAQTLHLFIFNFFDIASFLQATGNLKQLLRLKFSITSTFKPWNVKLQLERFMPN